MSATETSPLLSLNTENGGKITDAEQPPILQSHVVLVELIGAQHLDLRSSKNNSISRLNKRRLLEPYCVVKFGSKDIHSTNPLSEEGFSKKYPEDPIWSLKDDPLFLLPISSNDLLNNKPLTITIWARSSSGGIGIRSKSTPFEFCGKVRLKAEKVLEYCNEQRIELVLQDELGRNIIPTLAAGSSSKGKPILALRFRAASKADVRFVQAWSQINKSVANSGNTTTITNHRTALKGTGVLQEQDEHRQRATIVTELEGSQVSGASLASAMSNSVMSKVAQPAANKVRVKPYPDRDRPISTQYMLKSHIQAETTRPSKKWVEAGNGSLGKVYLEILSCHDLPNVDIGSSLGNLSDAFVCAVYGDALVETPVIDDELSPHWLPWTQRAFCFNMMHPSQVLYLAVFGFKRGLLNHRPIGRVEINPVNLQRDTVYNLQYNLSPSSHVTDRKVRKSEMYYWSCFAFDNALLNHSPSHGMPGFLKGHCGYNKSKVED
jgi:hypothetical protein